MEIQQRSPAICRAGAVGRGIWADAEKGKDIMGGPPTAQVYTKMKGRCDEGAPLLRPQQPAVWSWQTPDQLPLNR